MKILVTGGAGFIGSNFIKYIIKLGSDYKITNLDKLTYAGNLANLEEVEDNPQYAFVKGDIADYNLLKELFKGKKFDVEINFAAESHVDRSIIDAKPFIETNIKGTWVLLEVAKEFGSERFIQISTDEVYGSLGKTGKFSENSCLNPTTPYSASKASADILCQAYYKTYNLPIIIIRSSNTYGPYQFPEKLIPLTIINAMNEKELRVYGNGEHIRDWLYVEDNIRATALVLTSGKIGAIYNVGGECEKKNIEVVELICEILEKKLFCRNLKSKIKFIKDPRGKAHDYRYAMDCSKIKHELGWKITYDFEQGLNKTIEWYLKNNNWVKNILNKVK
jgi:dTDP-glucose 4,6-dehydratase